jgi:DNA-binding protein YbaB
MFGGLKDKWKQLQEMQQKVEEVKKRLATVSVVAKNEDASIRVICNGNREIEEIIIDRSKYPVDDGFIKELIKTLNEALQQSKNLEEGEMRNIAGNFLPGMDL